MTPTVDAAAARPAAPVRYPALAALGPTTHALLRVGAALLFMEHGLQKLFGFFGGIGPQGGTVQLMSLFGLAGVLEFVGGILLLIGLFTRPVALILAGEMIVAFFMAHFPRGGFPIQNMGELALLYFLVFLFLLGNGAGPWSVDAARGARGISTRDVAPV